VLRPLVVRALVLRPLVLRALVLRALVERLGVRLVPALVRRLGAFGAGVVLWAAEVCAPELSGVVAISWLLRCVVSGNSK
jgi:hypothetical protein